MMTQKSSTIEFYRYAFMVVLLAWHGGTNFFQNGYLVVEFFFILSGYLLMESFLRKPKTAVQYTVDKLKRMYLEYFVALCFSFLYFGLLRNLFYHTLSMELIFKFIYEMFLLQDIGLFNNGGFNPPTWYFSVLIWGGALLYYLLNKWTELSTHLFIPIISLISLAFLCNQGNSLEVYNNYGGIHLSLMRGIAEMGVGILLCVFAHSQYNKIRNSKWIDYFAIVAFIMTFYLFDAEENYDKYVFLTFPIIIFAGMQKKGFLNTIFRRKIWLKLGGITYDMYLIHAVLGGIARKGMESLGVNWNLFIFGGYVVIVTFAAFAFKKGCKMLQLSSLK